MYRTEASASLQSITDAIAELHGLSMSQWTLINS